MYTERINPLQDIITLIEHHLPALAADCTGPKAGVFTDHLMPAIASLKQFLRTEQVETDPRHFRTTIYGAHQKLMELTGSLMAWVTAQELCEPTTPLSRLCHNTCHDMNDLINTLAKQYAGSLPEDIYVPEGYKRITAYQLFHQLAELVDALRAHHTDPVLIDIMMPRFSDWTEDGADITLAQLNYLRLLKLELAHVVQQTSENDTPIDEVIQILFRALNFNSSMALQYCMRQILEKLHSLDGVEARHDFLAYCRMSISITPPLRNDLALDPKLPALHTQLLDLVADEEERLARREPLVVNLAPKMPLTIPSEHHAFLTKIQTRAKIYACSQQQASKISPQIFCKADGGALGAAAYDKSFRDIESSTVRCVLGYLEECISIVKRDFGDLL